MRALLNLAAALLLAPIANASWTTNFYPVTNAPLRVLDGTNWVFAKDVYRVELGGAVLERMAVMGMTSSTLQEPPVRMPWEHQVVAAAKSNLQAIAPNFLDLRHTNSTGLFTNFIDTTQAAYSNRFWTISNLLTFCELPTNFFDYTPVRFLSSWGLTNGNTNIASGFSTTHYGWEGIYRVVLALDYIHPTPGWYEQGLSDSIQTQAFTVSASDDCIYEQTDIPEAWATYTPTNRATNVITGSHSSLPTSTGGTMDLLQNADGRIFDTDESQTMRFWGVRYQWNLPDVLRPLAHFPHGTNAYHPTNAIDAQAFAKEGGVVLGHAFIDWRNPTSNAKLAVSPLVFSNVTRGAWAFENIGAGVYAIGSNLVAAYDANLPTPSDMTRNPDMIPDPGLGCDGGSEFAYGHYSDDFPYCGHSVMTFAYDLQNVPPYENDWDHTCSDDVLQSSIWVAYYQQAQLVGNVALKPGWRYR